MRGPIDFIVVGFEGNRFDGSILDAIAEAIDDGIIALIALEVIVKDPAGNITTLDINEVGDDYTVSMVEKYADELRPVEQDDVDEVASLMENDTAAGILIIEHLWALPLKEAIVKTGGVLIAEGRIHPEAAEELTIGRM